VPDLPDLRKSLSVPVTPEQAFRIFTEQAIEWLPSGHTFLADPQSVTMEPWPGGRFYERAADGTEATRGTVLAWSPPGRLVVTWRIGPGWRPLPDDERASQIEAEFTAAGPDQTEVTLTYRQLHRLGEFGQQVWQAVASASPGESLQRYAGAVARHRG
jgi:uncharacterized protein YndB with AHSA1/START domain